MEMPNSEKSQKGRHIERWQLISVLMAIYDAIAVNAPIYYSINNIALLKPHSKFN